MSQGEGRENEHIPIPASSAGTAVNVVGPLQSGNPGMRDGGGVVGETAPTCGSSLDSPLGTTVYIFHYLISSMASAPDIFFCCCLSFCFLLYFSFFPHSPLCLLRRCFISHSQSSHLPSTPFTQSSWCSAVLIVVPNAQGLFWNGMPVPRWWAHTILNNST